MDDLISREAALDAIDGIKPMRGNMEQLAMKALCWAAVKTIQPVAAVPVVHGRWINHKDEHQCSICKEFTVVDAHVWVQLRYDFCPNCGAKMDGEQEAR